MLKSVLVAAALAAGEARLHKPVHPQVKSLLTELKKAQPEATAQDAVHALSAYAQQETAKKHQRYQANLKAGLLRDSVVNTPFGQVVGVAGNTTNQYLGIPYAVPPTGALRWTQPQAFAEFPNSPQNAQSFGYICPQTEQLWALFTPGMSEDCLYLNIYTPAGTPPEGGWPVMLFAHGGSWVFGSGSFLLYDGETDVALVKDVVIVTINYRLGPLGFMGGDALRAESPDGSVGNYGFQDQRQALRFTRSIIASFGGNPSLVTLFGESAGGGSTTCHLISPRSAGLFERAIIESGSAAPWTAQPYNISATRFTEIAANAGCGGAADVLACMRGLNYSQLISADSGNVLQGVVEWSPVIDGVEIPDDPRALIAAGAVNPVPVMLGWNHDEGTLFNREKVTLNASDYVSAIASYLGPGLGQEVAAAYPLDTQSTPWWALTNILTDSCMLCPGIAMSRGLTAASVRNGAPVFTYYYTHVLWVIEYVVDLFKPLGCFHGSELTMVFDFSIALLGAGEKDLAQLFVAYWTNFAANGDPHAPGLPDWPAFGAAGNIAQIDTSSAGPNVTVIQNLHTPQCAFWGNLTIPPSAVFG